MEIRHNRGAIIRDTVLQHSSLQTERLQRKSKSENEEHSEFYHWRGKKKKKERIIKKKEDRNCQRLHDIISIPFKTALLCLEL